MARKKPENSNLGPEDLTDKEKQKLRRKHHEGNLDGDSPEYQKMLELANRKEKEIRGTKEVFRMEDDAKKQKELEKLLEDTAAKLGGKLDCNGKSILIDTATGIQDEAGNEQLIFTTTGSAITYIGVTNNTTGKAPTIASAGETNVGLVLDTAGTGSFGLCAPLTTTPVL